MDDYVRPQNRFQLTRFPLVMVLARHELIAPLACTPQMLV